MSKTEVNVRIYFPDGEMCQEMPQGFPILPVGAQYNIGYRVARVEVLDYTHNSGTCVEVGIYLEQHGMKVAVRIR